MSINNKRSYTEYTVTQPTTDFAIGFNDFNEGSKDIILVTLNGVLVESLGYATIRKNASTVRITPAITVGTVRLTRETDIDEPFHKFTSGALFTAKSMDENFEQIRHSQQEVNDGFKYSTQNITKLFNTTVTNLNNQYATFTQGTNSIINAFTQDINTRLTATQQSVTTILFNAAQNTKAVLDAFGVRVTTVEQAQVSLSKDLTGFSDKAADYAREAVDAAIEGVAIDANLVTDVLINAGGVSQRRLNTGIASVSDLIAIPNPYNNMRVYLKSYHAGFEKGGGWFTYNSNKALINNGVTIFNGWVRQIDNFITPFMAGATLDNEDNSIALQKAVNYAQANNIKLVGLNKTYYCHGVLFDSNLHFYDAKLICNKYDTDLVSVLDTVSTADILSNVYFENVHIDGKRDLHTGIRDVTGQEDGGRHGFRFYRHIDGVRMLNCSAVNCATDGIELFCRATKISNFIVEDCKFNDNRRHGGSGDSLDVVKFIRCEFKRNGLDTAAATGARNNKLGAWGDRPNGKIYSVGFDVEEYAGFAASKNYSFIDCDMRDNSYGSMTLYRTDDYTALDADVNLNILIQGGFYNAGVNNVSTNLGIEISPFSPWTDYRTAFRGIILRDVDLGGAKIYTRYTKNIEVFNLINCEQINIDGQGSAYFDKPYKHQNSESNVYIAGNEVRAQTEYANLPEFRLTTTATTAASVVLTMLESNKNASVKIIKDGTNLGGILFTLDSYWGTPIANIQGLIGGAGVTIDTYAQSIVPNVAGKGDLGSSAKRFASVYADNVSMSKSFGVWGVAAPLSRPPVTGLKAPANITEQNAVLNSIVASLVAYGLVVDNRT